MNILNSREIAEEGPCLSPEFIEQVLGGSLKIGVEAIKQAAYGAIALEEERQATELDLLRAEVAAWRGRFPKLEYYGGQIVPAADSDAWGPR